MAQPLVRTLRLKVCSESYGWLNSAAAEVNQVFNYCNETAFSAAVRTDRKRKWLTGFDLCRLTSGAAQYFDKIGADTIQRVCTDHAQSRKVAKRVRLRWRVSRGARRSLGWIPFKSTSLRRRGRAIRFCGKTFRVFERERLQEAKWKQGCFAQDAVGDWWLCLLVEFGVDRTVAPQESVGIDLGIRHAAVTSDGLRLEAGRYFRSAERQLTALWKRGHRRQAARLHRRIRRRRQDACHKFSRAVVDAYQNIFVGDVSSSKLVKTRMAKSVLDNGWGMLKEMLRYKGEHAGRTLKIVDERDTTRACSSCGALTGPSGMRQFAVSTMGMCSLW